MPTPNHQRPTENADAPYDSFEIVSTEEGYKAVFFKAAIRATTDREWPADTLCTLKDRQAHFQSQGYGTPLIDQAIAELLRLQNGELAP